MERATERYFFGWTLNNLFINLLINLFVYLLSESCTTCTQKDNKTKTKHVFTEQIND